MEKKTCLFLKGIRDTKYGIRDSVFKGKKKFFLKGKKKEFFYKKGKGKKKGVLFLKRY